MSNILCFSNDIFYEIYKYLCPSERFMFKIVCKDFHNFVKQSLKQFKPIDYTQKYHNTLLYPLGIVYGDVELVKMYYTLKHTTFITYFYKAIDEFSSMSTVDGYTGKELLCIFSIKTILKILSYSNISELLYIFNISMPINKLLLWNDYIGTGMFATKIEFDKICDQDFPYYYIELGYNHKFYTQDFICEIFKKYNIRYEVVVTSNGIHSVYIKLKKIHNNKMRHNIFRALLTHNQYETINILLQKFESFKDTTGKYQLFKNMTKKIITKFKPHKNITNKSSDENIMFSDFETI